MQNLFFILFQVLLIFPARTQVIYLNNASFEGEPQDATMPVGWFACTQATTPDILPGPWGVYEEPAEGDSFVGLITREDGSWEAMGQRLSQPLKQGDCYAFSLELAHSSTYADYNQPIQLQVWGGLRKCDQTQLLFESPLIQSSDWTTFAVEFFAEKELNYIRLEARLPGNSGPRRGNILIDNISSIKRCARAAR